MADMFGIRVREPNIAIDRPVMGTGQDCELEITQELEMKLADVLGVKDLNPNTEKLIEVMEEPGILNEVQTRQILNCHYINEFAKTLPEVPKWVKENISNFGF